MESGEAGLSVLLGVEKDHPQIEVRERKTPRKVDRTQPASASRVLQLKACATTSWLETQVL